MTEYSASRLLNCKPEATTEALHLAIEAARQTQQTARDYRQAVDRPGGQEWEGTTARAAQDTAAADEKAVYQATQHVLDETPKALDTITFQVTEFHRRAVDLYNEATTHGYKVSEDLTVEWIVQPRSTPDIIERGKANAAKFQQMIRGAYDKWWAAELDAQTEIDAISKELGTSYNPIGGLTASNGHLDGAYLQGGTQWDKDVLARVQAASTLTDADLKTLATGGKVDIGANRMQYLYQFAHSFDGKSPAEIAAIKASLPPEQREAMTRAFALVSNDQVRSGVANATGVSEDTKKNFIPMAGSRVNLPDSVASELGRGDRVGSGPLGVGVAADKAGAANIALHGVGEMQDVAKIFDGAGGYLNGSEAGHAMLDAATTYSNTQIDSLTGNPVHLTSDAHGSLQDAMADIYQSGAQDHVGVHDLVTAEPSTTDKFLRGVLEGNWGDQSGKVDDVIQWAGDHSQMGAETANAEGHWMAEHKPELQDMPGGGHFAQNNPELAGTSAHVQGEYLSQYADPDPTHRHDPGIQPFGKESEFRDMISTFDQGQYSGDIINEQAQAQHQQLLNDAARTGSDLDLNAAGRLSQGMLDGATDSVTQHPDPASLKAIKDVVGWVPNVDKVFTVGDIVQQLQQQGAQLPDNFAQDLAQAHSVGDVMSYHTSVLDAMLQAHPEIAHDPTIGRFIQDGHFNSAATDANPGLKEDAQVKLSSWFNNVAPQRYGVSIDHWLTQEGMGAKHQW
ncbi:Uncharacterised protein [Mycobacteroides abscessus subsp. abscessus]|uniref:TPR repeat region-containing protein n=1 Tax=Mycobacteroides abscessus TaxID=36809 RepID=UPI000927742E|nr:hypothetical protein [Mycobacteroides abscessus]SIG37891.1 Uncharacterised protein [Mycobacteroides abscessus subsp. abscessus]SLI42714.1 Uncharacterised protein [Mycobacteroides abscessus subsp. abscessus]